MRPMLATATTDLPVGEEWQHEVKWDGVRLLVETVDGESRVYTRNGNVATAGWPELQKPPHRDLLVDGEMIALNEQGKPDFRELHHRMHMRKPSEVAKAAADTPGFYMVFDLLRLDGRDLTSEPLERRRELLAGVEIGHLGWQVPEAHSDGEMLWEAAVSQGLEGVVSKRRDSRYRFDYRSRDWLKRAHRHRGSFVIGGWRPQEGTKDRLAALLVGEVTPDGLMYRGRVGSGIAGAKARMLQDLLTPSARDDSPFADEVPRVDASGTNWVEPLVVVDIDTHGLGYERLRQPSYQGIRTDLTPEDL